MRPFRTGSPELLSPAGGMTALRAAVANGADAVYVGVEAFNARRSAENLTLETLQVACEFAHLRGVRVYLTVNVVILPGEMGPVLELVDTAWARGVDAVIVQDLGLMRCIRKHLPHVRMHVSTQVNAHSSSTVSMLATMGASRVTLSRETSVDEIATLAEAGSHAGVEVESFVHGAICVCYSGQCLLSSLIGGRSANRGMCAQPCRLTYELLDRHGVPVATPGAHLLSPKDLAGLALLPELAASGVASLKIEGRMKSAEYVALVTGIYRKALDRAIAAPDSYEVRDGEVAVLAEAFNRGFSEAYLAQARGNDMMSYTRPNNRGVFVGRIRSTSEGAASLALETALSADDLIEVWTGSGRFAQTVGSMETGGERLDTVPAGTETRIRLESPVRVGDRVFRVRNARLLEAAVRTFEGENVAPVAVDVAVRMVIGEPLEISVTTSSGACATGLGEVVEAARTRAVTAEDVREHVGRFGGSGFEPATWDIALSPGAGIGFSELHRVRRAALEGLAAQILMPWSERRRTHPVVPALAGGAHRARRPSVVAVVRDAPSAKACLEAGADRVHLPVRVFERLADSERDVRMAPVFPRVMHDGEAGQSFALPADGCLVAATLGVFDRLGDRGEIEAHWSLNATNAHAASELADLGASFVWLSPELSSTQISDVAAASPVPVGIAIAGRQELMATEHCVLMAEGECSRECARCSRRSTIRRLRDRKGYEFPVWTDETGRTHLFNSVPLDLTSALVEVRRTGVAGLRLDLESYSAEEAACETRRVRHALDGDPFEPVAGATTTGHFFRGVS